MGHWRPQSPQCASLVCVLVSQPSAALLLQLPKPALHMPTPQVPIAQVCVATFVKAHRAPQAPQLLVSAPRTLTSQPLAGFMSQFAKPRLQLIPHVPAAQVGVPFVGMEQALLQLPQCMVLVCVSTQAIPHIINGAVQRDAHDPLMHVCPVPQALSQAPQCALLLRMSTHIAGVPHELCPVGQVIPVSGTHVEFTQISPALQSLG
jgi:hypothetical protein